MSRFFLLGLLCACALLSNLSAQPCSNDEVKITVSILVDKSPEELFWSLRKLDGTLIKQVNLDATYTRDSLYQWEVCQKAGECAFFTIEDSYGDGITPPGYFALSIDDSLYIKDSLLIYKATRNINCLPGYACNTAKKIDLGEYLAPHDNVWYEFIPDTSGQYRITTCSLATCDTKIWVFAKCSQGHHAEHNEGTLAFDDDLGNCGEQANLRVGLEAGKSYLIRIGDDREHCMEAEIPWAITYEGLISGCTDPDACNYNPLAAIEDSTCLMFGDPDCPRAPDLVISQGVLTSSAYLTHFNTSDPCLVEEGCLQGYGVRDIIRFTTRIYNRGDADYYVGTPGPDNPLFTKNNCHNHWHYDGYAEYLLYDEFGQEIPVGFKNGFCVSDVGGPTALIKYDCEKMGISAGCYDEYQKGLRCQWVDITDVPDGRYTLVTRVNWNNKPDSLGRREIDMLNNWAQVCVLLDRSSGVLQLDKEEDCEPYVDCAGVPYGDTPIDCTGECGGSTKFGDLDLNGIQEDEDVSNYLDGILNHTLAVNDCVDLSADGSISVYDAALLSACSLFGENHPNPNTGPKDYCRFPHNVPNPNHSIGLGILDYDLDKKYFDIGILTETTNVLAYQFEMSGLKITTVENLQDSQSFPMTPQTDGDSIVIGLSRLDSVIIRSSEWQALVRVYYEGPLDGEVCISNIIDIVNRKYERLDHYLENPCALQYTETVELEDALQFRLMPNPFDRFTRLSFNNPTGDRYELRISDISGRELQHFREITGEEVLIQAADLPKGICLYELKGPAGNISGKLVVY